MTFNEIQTEICDRINLSSVPDLARVGRAINRKYREVTSSLGIKHVSRRISTSAAMTPGVSTLQFPNTERVVAVYNRNMTPYFTLEEITLSELRDEQPYNASETPTRYAIVQMAADTVTIEVNCIPQTALTLYADADSTAATLSGTDEPVFSESFHDILISLVLVDEYMKVEKPLLSRTEYDRVYDAEKGRMGQLRHSIAVSTSKLQYQGKTGSGSSTGFAGTGGSASTFNGALNYTQTGLVTFSRGLNPPFAVNAGATKVANLDADKLDGEDGSAFHNAGNLNAGTVPDARFPATLPAASGVNLTALNASNLGSGTVPDARFPATLPAASGVNLTALNASNLGSGTVAEARLGSGTGNVNKLLRGNNTWGDAPGTTSDGASRIQQIAFAAIQSASADANTLDDYEEGTWTPTDTSGAALALTTTEGRYVKVGQLVIATCTLTYPATASGAVAQIGGLPFTATNSTNNMNGGSVNFQNSGTWFSAMITTNSTDIRFFDVSGTTRSNANLTTATLRLTMIYRCNA